MTLSKKLFNITNIFGVVTVVALILYYLNIIDETDQSVSRVDYTEVYYADRITKSHEKLIDKFNEKYKGRIKVIPLDLPFDKFSTNERKELLARSLRGKSEKIDVFAVDIVWAYRFAKWAENLSPYFSQKYLSGFIDPVIETCFYKDSLIAAPFTFDLSSMYYRDDLLSELPDYESIKTKIDQSISWQDFIALGQRLNVGSDRPFYLYPASDYEGLVCSFTELVLNQNRDFYNSGSIDLTKPEAKNALNILRKLIYTYNLTPKQVTAFTEYSCHKYFFENKGFFVRSWPAFFLDVPDTLDENIRNNIKRAPMPHIKGTEPAAVFGGWNLVVSKFSEHIPEAIEFVKFLQSPESQMEMFNANISLPILKSIYEDEQSSNAEVLSFYKRNLKYGVHRPLLEDYTRISDITSYFVRKVLMEELETDEALKEATRMINSNEVIFK